MSQTDQILKRLEEAGDRGVHGFHLKPIAWRYPARIKDLKGQGYEITSETEKLGDAVGVRYTLVGSSADTPGGVQRAESPSSHSAPHVGTASSQEPLQLGLSPKAPSAYDCWEDAA